MTRSDYAYAADNQLFQRNPVCGMCWRICMDMCEEWGEGGELYANMRSAARQEDIYLSAKAGKSNTLSIIEMMWNE